LAHAASGAAALQKEVEALRDECKQLEHATDAVRAAMNTLVAEVDALSAADKRAESQLNAAKVRPACIAKGQRGVPWLTPRRRRRATRRRRRTTRNCSRTSCRLMN
jgi:hypothetical protein